MARQRTKLTLLHWGLIIIFAGLVSPILMTAVQGAAGSRSEQMGRSVASLMFLVTGLVLCVVHLVRSRK